MNTFEHIFYHQIIICFNFSALMVDYAWQVRNKSLNHYHAYIHALLIVEIMYMIIGVEKMYQGKSIIKLMETGVTDSR